MMNNPGTADFPSYQPPQPRTTLPLFNVRMVTALIFINGGLFAIDLISQRSVFSIGALVPVLVLQYQQWWRLITSGFIHADILHIGANLYALYGLGTLVERFYGPWRTIGIYIVSLLGAGSLVTLFSALSIPTVGASGAIMGFLGTALFYFWRYRNLLTQGRRYLGELLKMALINIGIGLLPGISMWGHLGGLLFGVAMGWILLPTYRPEGIEVRVLKILPLKSRAWLLIFFMLAIQIALLALAYFWRVSP